jgi:hypothetical protein
MDNSVLQIILKVKDEASQALNNAGKQIDETKDKIGGMGKSFAIAGGMMTGAGIAGVAVMKDWIEKANDAQVQMAKVESSLWNVSDSMKVGFEKLRGEVEKTSKSFIQLGFDDEDSAEAMSKSLLVTNDVTKANQLMALSADFARMKGMGLVEANQKMNLAFMGNKKVLKELGIVLKDGATQMDILSEIQKKTAGQADAYMGTMSGQMAKVQVEIDNMKEALGDRLIPILWQVIEPISKFITNLSEMDPKLFDIIAKVTLVATAIGLIGGPILILIAMLPALTAGFAVLGSTMLVPLAIIGAIMVAVGLLAYAWITNWGDVQGKTQAVVDWFTTYVVPAFTVAFEIIQKIVTIVMDIFKQKFQEAKEKVDLLYKTFKTLVDYFEPSITGMQKALEKSMPEWIKQLTPVIQVFKDIADWIGRVLGKVDEFVKKLTGKGIESIALNSMLKMGGISIPFFADGGYVGQTGPAIVHQGEFVLSKKMLASGQSPITNNNQPVNVNVVAYSEADWNVLGTRLAFAIRNSR